MWELVLRVIPVKGSAPFYELLVPGERSRTFDSPSDLGEYLTTLDVTKLEVDHRPGALASP